MSFFRLNLSNVQLTASRLKSILNWWPPFSLGPGIRVSRIADDFQHAKVELPLRFYNQNYVGTHFGGSLYAMCDPMYMLLLIQNLGRDFIVWDKSAQIQYIKPGKGLVSAEFTISNELLSSLKSLEAGEKKMVDLPVDVKDINGRTVAKVVKTLYIRRK